MHRRKSASINVCTHVNRSVCFDHYKAVQVVYKIRLEKSQSVLVKRPFWSSCGAISLALMGHLSGLDADLPVRRLISVLSFSAGVCEVYGFNCLYLTLLTFLMKALDQDVSCVFRPLTGCCVSVVFIQLLAFFVPSWDLVLLVTTGN